MVKVLLDGIVNFGGQWSGRRGRRQNEAVSGPDGPGRRVGAGSWRDVRSGCAICGGFSGCSSRRPEWMYAVRVSTVSGGIAMYQIIGRKARCLTCFFRKISGLRDFVYADGHTTHCLNLPSRMPAHCRLDVLRRLSSRRRLGARRRFNTRRRLGARRRLSARRRINARRRFDARRRFNTRRRLGARRRRHINPATPPTFKLRTFTPFEAVAILRSLFVHNA